MAIKSEVSGEWVEEIFVSVVVNTETPGFAMGGNILVVLGAEKRLKIGGVGTVGARYWMPLWGCLRVVEELKSPCGDRGFLWYKLVSCKLLPF